MTDEQQPDLTAEKEREEEASSSGIEIRPAVLEIDDDDDTLDEADEAGEPGDADDDDDDAIEDADDVAVTADV
jgi:hypothetical protein